jgi:hypothetical protein
LLAGLRATFGAKLFCAGPARLSCVGLVREHGVEAPGADAATEPAKEPGALGAVDADEDAIRKHTEAPVQQH